MDARAYEMMAETEDRHWWWSGRREILATVLDQLFADKSLPDGALFDLGCGVGSNLPVLERYGAAIGLDGSELAVACAHRRGRIGVRLRDLARGTAALEGFERGSASVVLLADVLEHLDDERPALDLASQLLAPGGALVVTVPAFEMLWGPSDVFNHHRRRYDRASLSRAIAPVFRITRMSYFNFFLFAPIALARALSKWAHRPGEEEIGLPMPPVNAALRRVFASEAALLERTDLPFGVSLLCVARKPA